MTRYKATVKEIVDGDTFTTVGGTVIRLARVKAPEKGQSGYQKAKKDLEDLIGGKAIIYDRVSIDVYGRTVAEVWLGSSNVNDVMIALGWS